MQIAYKLHLHIPLGLFATRAGNRKDQNGSRRETDDIYIQPEVYIGLMC